MNKVESMPTKTRLPGRPRAIPEHIEPVATNLWQKGYVYRAIVRILNISEYGINTHYNSIRKILIRLGKVVGE